MADVSSWDTACLFWSCPNQREGLYAPLCRGHLLDAWRYVESHPGIRPESLLPREPPELPPRPELPSAPVVYYLRRGNGRIKIGTTINLKSRIMGLGEPWPVAVLAVEWGGRELEAARHADFANDRRYDGASSSEEFVSTPRLLAHIEQIRAEFGEPEAFPDEQKRRTRECRRTRVDTPP